MPARKNRRDKFRGRIVKTVVQIGDKCVLKIDAEARSWGNNPAPDGTIVEVVTFGESNYTRVQNFGHAPGIYVNHAHTTCKFPDGSIKPVGSWSLTPIKENTTFWSNVPERLRDLPETRLYEGDRVTAINPRFNREPFLGVVEYINYHYLGEKRNDGSPMPEYTIRVDDGRCVDFNDAHITLLSRGNVWKCYHKQPLVFGDLREEADFFKRLGHTEEVRNPKTGLYSWTLDEVLDAIWRGQAHGFSADHGLFGMSKDVQHNVIRFKDANLGARVAAETLRGFAKAPR